MTKGIKGLFKSLKRNSKESDILKLASLPDVQQEGKFRRGYKMASIKETAQVSGALQMMGREIPVTIKTQVLMKIIEK